MLGKGREHIMSTTGWIVLGVIAVVVLWIISVYNGLVSMGQRVSQAFADIDVQLRQRHDLIPNLVETVKGYAAHERGTLEDVIKARNAAVSRGRRPRPPPRLGSPACSAGSSRFRKPIRTSRPTPISSNCRHS
jgi:hypothetical protein